LAGSIRGQVFDKDCTQKQSPGKEKERIELLAYEGRTPAQQLQKYSSGNTNNRSNDRRQDEPFQNADKNDRFFC
jgi:hypothetical protein